MVQLSVEISKRDDKERSIKMIVHFLRLGSMTLLLIMVGGCGTILSNRSSNEIYARRTACKNDCTIPRMYSGTAIDICGVKEGSSMALVDTPLSFIADTVILPYTIYRQINDGNIVSKATCSVDSRIAGGGLAHENFKRNLYRNTGKNLDEIPPYQFPQEKNLIGSVPLQNGNVENRYKFNKTCILIYEVDPKTRKIVGAGFEGSERDCSIVP